MRRPFGRRAAANPKATVQISGRNVELSPLSTDDATLVVRASQGDVTAEMLTLLYEVAGRACRSVERAELLTLTPEQIGNVLGRALAISPGRWLTGQPAPR